MKETIKRLRIKKTEVLRGGFESPANFRVETNADEANNELDVSVHELNVPSTNVTTVNNVRTLSVPKKLFVKVNNQSSVPHTYGQGAEEVIIRTKGKSLEAIYQFSVPFDRLLPKDNIILVFQNEDKPENEIVYIEVFAEPEDNFLSVRLDRPGTEATADLTLWDAIKSRWTDISSNTLKFNEYRNFIDAIVFGNVPGDVQEPNGRTFENTQSTTTRDGSRFRSPFIKSEEYNLIKFATEFYMMARFGMDTRQLGSYAVEGKLPYYKLIVDNLKDNAAIQKVLALPAANAPALAGQDAVTYERIYNPIMVELIWSYWMEQGMLSQTMNVVNLRFQNRKGAGYADPLLRFDADPLRPLSHILWGYIQDEQHRLSLQRRVYEYDHEYGLTLTGRAVKPVMPIDSRVPFLEAFHNLLNQCIFYYYEADDTTRIADAFPILNSLKEVHLLLAEGNHNAYGNLTWTARHEMMVQQYILSRSEMREFLGGRVMVPYPETWMDRVDAMRSIQGWGGPGIIHYYELAVHGEQILLSIRYGNWSDVTLDRNNAANWAQAFRNSIQRYVHAYRAVTGVDLSAESIQSSNAFALQPSFLIQQRMLQDRARTRRA